MATAKKPAAKKPSSKSTTTKKATSKKTVTKAASHNKTANKKTSPEFRSFKLAPNQPPFKSFRITRQTVYWLILVCFIIFAQLWIIKLQIDVSNLIELQQNEILNATN